MVKRVREEALDYTKDGKITPEDVLNTGAIWDERKNEKVRIQVKVSQENYLFILQKAKRTGTTVSAVAALLLDEQIQELIAAYEARSAVASERQIMEEKRRYDEYMARRKLG